MTLSIRVPQGTDTVPGQTGDAPTILGWIIGMTVWAATCVFLLAGWAITEARADWKTMPRRYQAAFTAGIAIISLALVGLSLS